MTASTFNGEHGCFRAAPGLLAAAALLLAAGCDWQPPGGPIPRPVPAEEVTDFKTLYESNCAGCHGKDGNLGPAPPLNDKTFLSIVPDEELQMVVAYGRRGTLMPAWSKGKGGPLTDKQVEALAQGIKKQWPLPEKPEGEPPPLVAEGKARGDKDAGLKVFAAACARCHGDDGKGGEKTGAVNDPAFLELLSDRALRRIVITGRPDLGMPGYGPAAGRPPEFKPLTSEDVGNLVALFDYWRTGRVDK